jgi:hypothetical protein
VQILGFEPSYGPVGRVMFSARGARKIELNVGPTQMVPAGSYVIPP